MENLVIDFCRPIMRRLPNFGEASVRATHHFLKPEEIGFYKPYLLKYALPACRLYGIKTNEGKLCAFIGLSDDKIEMLFVNPKFFKNGCGRRLVDFAEREKNIKKVDVNEENPQALAFYLHMGFNIAGRATGRQRQAPPAPFPAKGLFYPRRNE